MIGAPLRVTHLVPALFDDKIGVVGGGERYAFELARHMAERTPTRLVTFGLENSSRTEGKLRIDIIGRAWHIGGQPSNPFSFRLIRELRNSDVIHCHQLHIVATTAAAFFARATKKRVFVTDLGGGAGGIMSALDTESWFDAHLHISSYSEMIAKHRPLTRSEVILGGVDTDRFVPGNGENGSGAVLFVGRILPHKGIDVLIRALPRGMSLDIVGRAYHQRYLDDLHKLAVDKRVRFITDVSDNDLVATYQRASCVVLPSVFETMYGEVTLVPELLGQTLLEGMACGRPVICSDVASMPEIVTDNETGFVVTGGDVDALRRKLEWIRDHSADAEEMGKKGRARVLREFQWSDVVDRCLAAYDA